MTICEKDPLLDGGSRKGYNSLSYAGEQAGDSMSDNLCLSPLNGLDLIPGVLQERISSTEKDKMAYTWHDIEVFTSGKEGQRRFFGRNRNPEERKHILKHVHGVAHPGELLAIMGSSGAGKTTLLNALTFRSSAGMVVTGQRAVNGQPVGPNTLTSLSAYVQQQDLFIGTLTVREHLIFQAMVRMDRDIPYRLRKIRVAEVITELALSKCEHTLIGVTGRIKGISGGEMKRLSFASEVLTNPPLMFCDEPTSGLDSFMAQNVVGVLKSMALKGKTIVCTIHQPSSEVFALFDKVLLMAEGRVAFLGTTADACEFFRQMGATCPSNYNPADFFIQLLAVVPNREESCRQAIEMISDKFAKSEAGQQLFEETMPKSKLLTPLGATPARRSPYKAGWWAQFHAVLWRSWLSMIKEPMMIQVRVMQTMMVSIVIGLIYFGQELNQQGVMNINGALFLFLTNMTFQNVFAVINVFCQELPLFLREHFNGMYRTDVYFLCKTLSEIPVFVFIPIVFTSVAYYMVGLNPPVLKFFTAIAVVTLVANVATSFGYMISCASSSVTMALSIGPPIIIPFLLFGGFFLNSGSVPSYFVWLSYLSWFRYGNEALIINQWSGVESIDCSRTNTTCPRNGDVVMETLNFKESNFAVDLLCLVGLIFFFRLVAFLALLCRTCRKK